jgi:Tol biopolymer transport system component
LTDLDDRFDALGRVRPPELWRDIEGREPRPLPFPPTRRRAVAIVVALALASAGLGVAALTFGGSERPKQTAAAVLDGRIAFAGLREATWNIYTIEPDGAHLMMLTNLTGQVADDPAWSPDGQRIAYVVRESNGASDIWVINADGSGAYALTSGPGSSWGPTWSPDGSRLAYTHSAPGRADQIWIVGADGSNPRAFTYCDPPECVQDGSPAWSPDGSRIAFVRVSGAGAIIPVSVFIWPVEDSGPKPEAIELDSATWASDVAWSPDASMLVFARSTSAGASFGLWQVDADGSALGPLGDRPSAQSPSWSPDGRHIAFMAPIGPERATLYVMDADGTGVHQIPGLPEEAIFPAWQPEVASEPTPSPSTVPDGSISAEGRALPEGRLLVQVDGRRVEALDEGAERSTLVGRDLVALDLSPDGSRLLVSTPWDSVGPESALDSLDLTTGERTTIAQFDGWSLPARWSPDGSMVAYRIGEQNTLCIRDLATIETRCLPELGRVYEFDWSPDSSRLILDPGPPDPLTILDVATYQTTVVARWDDRAVVDAVADAGLGQPVAIQFEGPRWSPSGKYIAALAMVRTERGYSGNVVLAFDLNGAVVARGVPFGEYSDARGWSPAADAFAYANGEPPYRIVDARVLDAETHEDRSLISADGDRTIQSLAWSPSGRWVAVVLVGPDQGWFVSEIQIVDTTGVDPPMTFRSKGLPQLVDWGP